MQDFRAAFLQRHSLVSRASTALTDDAVTDAAPADAGADAIIDPDLRIIDPHHHLWPDRHGGFDQYLPSDFMADRLSGHDVCATVYMECHAHYRQEGPNELRCVGETEFADAVGREADATGGCSQGLCAAIVAAADLTLGDRLAAVLEAHQEASPTRLRGVRCMTAWDADPALRFSGVNTRPGMMVEAEFRAGFRRLAALGLSFDAWFFPPQVADVVALAREFPGVTIVIDHLASPLGIGARARDRAAALAEWRASLILLAQCPNTVMKLGGLGAGLAGESWAVAAGCSATSHVAATVRPFVTEAIELFGPERCMFESNFPVDRASYSYRTLWNAFKVLTRSWSSTERAALFHGTAARVYSLSVN
jgi:L-fuconolactonase